MSSYYEDTTYVDDVEWNRINSVINDTEAYIVAMQSAIAQIEAEIYELRVQSEEEHKARVEAANAAFASLRDSFNTALNSTTTLMENQANVVETSFNNNISELRSHSADLGHQISNIGDHFNQISNHITATTGRVTAIGDMLNNLQGQIGILNQNLQGIGDRVTDVATAFNTAFQSHMDSIVSVGEKANALVASLDNMISQIRELKPEVFEPEKYRELRSVRELTVSNMSVGDYNAALACSQNSIISASALLARLVVENEQFNNALYATKQGVALIQGRIAAFEAEGVLRHAASGIEYDYDISHWSNGRFQQIRDDFNHLAELLDDPCLNFEQLQNITHQLEIIDNNLSICDRKAREARFAGIAVQGLAERIFNRLGETNWELSQWGYAGQDNRNAFTMVYENGAGDSVAMVISPKNPESPAFMIEAFSDDEFRRAEIKDGINAELQESGVEISNLNVNNDCQMNTSPEAFIRRVV